MTLKPALLATAAVALLAAASPAFAQAPPPPPPPPQGVAPPPPQAVMVLTPVAIDKMQADNVVAVKGSVAEIFGNKFILLDDTGRALVELGPQGEEGGAVVAKGEQVMVQGRFERGFIVAQLVSHADGRNQAFGPPPRPPRDAAADHGPGGRRPPPPPR